MKNEKFLMLIVILVVSITAIFAVVTVEEKTPEEREETEIIQQMVDDYERKKVGVNTGAPVIVAETNKQLEEDENKQLEETEQSQQQETNYVLNKNTGKFHYETCSSVDQMKPYNKGYHTGTREEVIARGYDPCGRCRP